MDPTGDVRSKLARKVIASYYEPRIDELALLTRAQLESDRGPVRRTTIGGVEWEQWRLEAECLHYYLQVNMEEGSSYFKDRFKEAQRNNHLMRMQFLLSEIGVAGHRHPVYLCWFANSSRHPPRLARFQGHARLSGRDLPHLRGTRW